MSQSQESLGGRQTPYDPSQDSEPIVKEAPLSTPNKNTSDSASLSQTLQPTLGTSQGMNSLEQDERKPETIVTIFDVASEIENMLHGLVSLNLHTDTYFNLKY